MNSSSTQVGYEDLSSPRPSSETTRDDPTDSRGARVSVVVPVYNTGPYLLPALRSLADQDLPDDQYDVIAVDDGSTDGSGELLDVWAAEHPNVTVVHQANSGWPGQPRNRGREISSATYVFFMDGDDYLATGALRQMTDFADEHGSDVVVVKCRGVNGRYCPNRAWRGTSVDSDLETAFLTLTPHKLFRRSFLVENDLRFPEGKVRLEDGMFLARVYLTASRVSTLADTTYYFLTRREGDTNISSETLDPVGYTGSLRVIGQTVRGLCRDTDLADRVVLELYRRKALRVFAPDRFLGFTPATQQDWVTAVADLAEDLVPEVLDQLLPEPFRTRSRLARARDAAALVDFCRGQSPTGPVIAPRPLRRLLNALRVRGRLVTHPTVHLVARSTSMELGRDGLVVTGRARLRGRSPAHLRLDLVLRGRADPGTASLQVPTTAFPLDAEGVQGWRATLRREQLLGLPEGRYDVLLRDRRGELEARVHGVVGLDLPRPVRYPRRRRSVRAYVTSRGWLVLVFSAHGKRVSVPATAP